MNDVICTDVEDHEGYHSCKRNTFSEFVLLIYSIYKNNPFDFFSALLAVPVRFQLCKCQLCRTSLWIVGERFLGMAFTSTGCVCGWEHGLELR